MALYYLNTLHYINFINQDESQGPVHTICPHVKPFCSPLLFSDCNAILIQFIFDSMTPSQMELIKFRPLLLTPVPFHRFCLDGHISIHLTLAMGSHIVWEVYSASRWANRVVSRSSGLSGSVFEVVARWSGVQPFWSAWLMSVFGWARRAVAMSKATSEPQSVGVTALWRLVRRQRSLRFTSFLTEILRLNPQSPIPFLIFPSRHDR